MLSIKVRRALDTARKVEFKGTKSGRARVVDVDAETVKVLKRWRAQRGSLALDLTAPMRWCSARCTDHRATR